MVTLVNLKKNDNFIITDYYLDSETDDLGHIEYDIETKSVVHFTYSKEDEQSYVKYGFKKAIVAIQGLIKEDTFPETYRYIWY